LNLKTAEPVELTSADDIALAEQLKDAYDRVRAELNKVIIGQQDVVEYMLLSVFAGGNSLLVGVPGLAKTLLVHTLAQTLNLKFSRIQFTPDLMPSDITGTDLIQDDPETGRRKMVFSPGPVFANVVLADEINRTPPKTQAALLEAMQEHRVTVQGVTYRLEEPFYVFATQNPIELEGTYPLPEAQLDRFMFQIIIDHLPEEEEMTVVRSTTAVQVADLQPVVNAAEILAFQRLVRRVPISDPVLRYAVNLVRATRPPREAGQPSSNGAGSSHDFVRRWVAHGASVRAAQFLVLGGKARALMRGRYTPGFEDIRAMAKPVLRHRVLTNFHAESERITTDHIIDQLLEAMPVPRSGLS